VKRFRRLEAIVRTIARYTYLVITSLFLLGILTQVYFAGLTMLAGRPSMGNHSGLGLLLSFLIWPLIILAYLARLSRWMKTLSWLTLVIYFLMLVAVSLRDSAPFVAAFHPILALALFIVVVSLLIRAWGVTRERLDKAASPSEVARIGKSTAG
jgi:hypothetical protein